MAKWNADRGFGFITPASGGADVFVHVSAFPRDGVAPRIGELISFERQQQADGKSRAVSIMRAGATGRARRPRAIRTSPASVARTALKAVAGLAIVGLAVLLAPGLLKPTAVASPAAQTPPEGLAGLSQPSQFKCDGRTHCSEMHSCEEATYFIQNCPGTKMDGDNDGQPCEDALCP